MIEQGQNDEDFVGHPMPYKQKYGKTHKTVTSSWDELKDFVEACIATDKTSDKFQDLQKQHKQNVNSAECSKQSQKQQRK